MSTVPVPIDQTALSPMALRLPEGLSYDQWVEVGEHVASRHHTSLWWIGDWLVYGQLFFESGEHDESDTRTVLEERTGLPQSTVKVARWVSAAFPPPRRRQSLSWSHHREVAAKDLTAEQADDLLDQAEANGWSTRQLGREVTRVTAVPAASEPDDKPAKPRPRCAQPSCRTEQLDGAPVPVCEQHGQELVDWWQERAS